MKWQLFEYALSVIGDVKVKRETHFVKLFQCHDDLCDVDPHLILGEVFFIVEMGEQLPATHVVQNDVQLRFRLEGVVHRHEERRSLDRFQHL